jgi:hypothetical protein
VTPTSSLTKQWNHCFEKNIRYHANLGYRNLHSDLQEPEKKQNNDINLRLHTAPQ